MKEKQNRITVSVWAWLYEKHNYSIVSDNVFDKKALGIDLSIATDNKILDNFFKKYFVPYTGQWIYKHPELDKLDRLCRYVRTLDHV